MSGGGSTTGSTSTSLLERAKDLDPVAWRRLVKLYGPFVYRWCRQMGLQSHDAMDVGQNVFHTVAERIGGFRRERPGDSFRAWLWVITRNKLKEFHRVNVKSPRAVGGASQILGQLPDLPPEDSAEFSEPNTRAAFLLRALDVVRGDVEQSTWQAFWRATVNGDKASEIAADLQMSCKAVRQAKYRVLKRLREEMTELF